MSTTSDNYGLTVLTDSDVMDITVIGANAVKIDAALNTIATDGVFQTAGGTGTIITLTDVTLKNGYPKTFIASADNNSAGTTINGKPLYKPGTTTPPTLKKDKAYEIWYNTTGVCFFLKASAEGTAIASNVLATKTFSNDSDVGIPGSMISNNIPSTTLSINGVYTIPIGYHPGTEIVTQSVTAKGAATYNPSTSAQTIAAAQYLSGAQTISPVTGNTTPADVVLGKVFSSGNGIDLTGIATIASLGGAQCTTGTFGRGDSYVTVPLAFTPNFVATMKTDGTIINIRSDLGWYYPDIYIDGTTVHKAAANTYIDLITNGFYWHASGGNGDSYNYIAIKY